VSSNKEEFENWCQKNLPEFDAITVDHVYAAWQKDRAPSAEKERPRVAQNLLHCYNAEELSHLLSEALFLESEAQQDVCNLRERVAELTGEVAIQNELMQEMVYTESTVGRKSIASSLDRAGRRTNQTSAVVFDEEPDLKWNSENNRHTWPAQDLQKISSEVADYMEPNSETVIKIICAKLLPERFLRVTFKDDGNEQSVEQSWVSQPQKEE
jgi:hypothetical protein